MQDKVSNRVHMVRPDRNSVGGIREVRAMTVQQLRPPVVTGEIEAARTAIARAATTPLGSLCSRGLEDALADLISLEAQVASLRLEVLAEADRRGVAGDTGDTGT